MPRWAKAVAAVVVVLALVAAAAPFVLRKLLPPEKVRALVVSNARKALHRDVKLEGVSYGLIQGLTLEGLSVSEAPDFSAGTFLELRRFHLRLSLMALLRRRIVVDRVDADGLKLSIVKKKDGLYNFSDLLQSSGAPAPGGGAPAGAGPAAQAGGAAFALAVRSASVSGGSVSYADRATGDALTVSGLDADVNGFRLSGPFDADVSLRAKGRWGGRDVDGAASASGRFDLGGRDPKRFSARVRKLSADWKGLTLAGKADVKGLGPFQGSADLTLAKGGRELLGLSWSGKLERRPAAAYGLEGSGAVALETKGFKSEDLAALGAPANFSLPALSVKGKLALAGDTLSAQDVFLKTPIGSVQGSGGARGLSKGPLVPTVSARLDLDLPSFSGSQLPGSGLPGGLTLPAMTLAGSVRIAGDSAAFDGLTASMKQGRIAVSGSAAGLRSRKPKLDLDVQAKLSLPELTAAQLPFAALPKGLRTPAADLDGRARLKGDELTLSSLDVRTKAGTVTLSGTVKGVMSGDYEPALGVSAALSLPALTAADIPAGLAPEGFHLPASRWDGQLFASRDVVRIKSLRAVAGRNDVELVNTTLSGLRGPKPQIDATVKCRSFALEELSDLTPAIREMDVKGSGFFALSAVGALSRPILAGKLQFKTLGAVVQGLHLSGFTGTASFDEHRIDVPNLRGKVENGDLDLDLTVKDYVKHPAVDLQAELSEFDLGKFLDAKAKVAAAGEQRAQRKAEAAGKPAAPAEPVAMDLKGRLTVKRLVHPNFQANDVRADWDLSDVTPDFRRLGGTASFTAAGGGRFIDLSKALISSKLLRALLMPLFVIPSIGGQAASIDNATYSELMGDYSFSRGLMTIRDSHVNSSIGAVRDEGTIDLPDEKLDMTVTADILHLPTIVMGVGGSFDHPTHHLKLQKMLTPQLQQQGQKLLKSIFK